MEFLSDFKALYRQNNLSVEKTLETEFVVNLINYHLTGRKSKK